MKFHPDKVANLGEDIKKSATEKFRAVNEAYEHLKKYENLCKQKTIMSQLVTIRTFCI